MKNILVITFCCCCLCNGMEKGYKKLSDGETSDEQKSSRQKKKGKVKVVCTDNTEDGRVTRAVVIEETPKAKKVKVRVLYGEKKLI